MKTSELVLQTLEKYILNSVYTRIEDLEFGGIILYDVGSVWRENFKVIYKNNKNKIIEVVDKYDLLSSGNVNGKCKKLIEELIEDNDLLNANDIIVIDDISCFHWLSEDCKSYAIFPKNSEISNSLAVSVDFDVEEPVFTFSVRGYSNELYFSRNAKLPVDKIFSVFKKPLFNESLLYYKQNLEKSISEINAEIDSAEKRLKFLNERKKKYEKIIKSENLDKNILKYTDKTKISAKRLLKEIE